MWLWGRPLEHGNSVSDQTLNKDRFSHPQQLPIHGQQLLRTLKNNFQAQVILWGIISKWASIFKERLGRSNDRSNMVTRLHSFKGLQSIFSPLMTESLAISPSMDDYAMLATKTQAGIFSEFMVCSVGVLCMLPYLQTRKHGNVMCLNKEDPRWLQSCSIYEGTGISMWHCAPFLDL